MTASEMTDASDDAAKGITVSAETLRAVCRYVEGCEAALGRRILSGDIRITPVKGSGYLPCTFCAFRSVCRFDRRIPGMEEAGIRKDKNEDVLQEILDAAAGKEAAP